VVCEPQDVHIARFDAEDEGAVFYAYFLLGNGEESAIKQIWEYDRGTLAKDLSAHLLYGTTTAATFAGLAKR
jgi:hypothetical protein